MKINLATAKDIPAMSALLGILFSQEAEFQPDENAQYRGLVSIINQPELGVIIVARKGGEVLGMVSLLYTISTALGSRVAILEDMVVSPNARGSGVGTKLLQYAIQFARLKGCQRITLLTDADNTSAHSLYQKQGFTPSAMIPFRLALD